MEFKSVVFNAAKDGKLRRLKLFLDHRPKDEVQILVAAKTNGATPLVMASRNGHLEVADYLLEKCSANIEQVGSVTFDGETIEGAPPLWCAAAAGHLNVVRSLVAHGASVNSTTKTNSTPLRAACFDGHFEIVRFLVEHGADIEIANRHGHTCLMIACYKGHLQIATYLIEHGANVNRKSVKGNTALHDCAESGSLDILRLLLQQGAKMDVDSYGMTPLLAAALTGHAPVVEFLVSQANCERMDRIDALELLGATYVDKKRDSFGALQFWRRALEERYAAGLIPIPKPVANPVAAYSNTIEVTSVSQLDELLCDPDQMRMQALLVRERILGPAHPDTSYYIRYRGAVYADMGDFSRCIKLWMYALDMQQHILEPLSPMTQSSLLSFAELFSFMLSDSRSRMRRVPPVTFADVLGVFERSVLELETAMQHPEHDQAYFHRTLLIALHLCGLMCRLQQPHLISEEDSQLKRAVYRLVRLNPKGQNSQTPLHLACQRDGSCLGRYPVCTFPSSDVVDLLLEVGADPNATDADLNTPLHIAAGFKPCARIIVHSLLYHGAHLDRVNAAKQTALQLSTSPALLDVCPLRFTNLQCLCARTIMRLQLPYEGVIPQRLEAFVQAH